MMKSPSITLVIPTYNRAGLLKKTIESIISQIFKDWELIVVDDGSTDETADLMDELAQADLRIKYYSRPTDRKKGANSCRNYGYEISKGKYIKWVDSDDLLVADCLEKQFEIMRANDELQLCLGYGHFFDDLTGESLENWSRNDASDSLLYDFIKNNIRWPIGGLLWKKEFFKTAPFHENLKNSQEWLMHSEALSVLKENEIYNLKEIVYLIRRGNLRMSSSRSGDYYFNQAKARSILLSKVKFTKGVTVSWNLVKQILIFNFHALRQHKKK